MLLDDLTVYIISAGEETYEECLASLERQGFSFKIDFINGVYPMSRAFQTMADRCTTKYFMQVDADMILEPSAVKRLYEGARETGFFTAIIYGQLYEEGFGVGGSVRLWKKHLFRLFSFRDRRTVDRDFYRRIRLFGFRKRKVEGILGIHRPRYSVFSDYLKTKSDIEKWRFLGRDPEGYAYDTLKQTWNTCPGGGYRLLGTLMGALTGWNRVVRSKNIEIERKRFESVLGLLCEDGLLTLSEEMNLQDFHCLTQHFFEAYNDRTNDLTEAKAYLCETVFQVFGKSKIHRNGEDIRNLHEAALL